MNTINKAISKSILHFLRIFPTKNMMDALFVEYINFPHGIENNTKTPPPHTHLWETLRVDVMHFSKAQKKAYISKMPHAHLKALVKTPERVSFHIHGAENLTSSEHMKYYSSINHRNNKSKACFLAIIGLILASIGTYNIAGLLY